MTTWFVKNLGDAMLAGAGLHEIEQLVQEHYSHLATATLPSIFTRHEAEGRLHCELKVYFSPEAADLARQVKALPCAVPSKDGLTDFFFHTR